MDATQRQRQMRRGVTALRHQFAQGGSGVFSEVLAGADTVQVIETEVSNFRDRCYPPLTTLRLFIGQVLLEDGACQDVVGRYLSECVATAGLSLAPRSDAPNPFCC